jgi:SulP family sulfate permease
MTTASPTARLAALIRRAGRPTPGDAVAGLSVALVLVPQSLAYAGLAGLPPERGLYAAAFVPVAAALFASSPYLQTGPTALTSLLTLGALSALAAPFSAEFVALAALLALVVGLVRLATGLLRAGAIAYLMSQPVVLGFSSAAAILIVASQVPAVLGVPSTGGNPLVAAGTAVVDPSTWSSVAILLAAMSLALVAGARRIHPLLPGALLAVVLGVVLSTVISYTGATVGSFEPGLPPFSLDLPWYAVPALLLPGAVIALLGFAEPASIARRYATQERRAWDPNREFVSQGVANFVAAISGAFPVGGSFSRTALNRLAGARSQWSAAITSLVVIAFLPVSSILAPLPVAVLAGVIIGSVAPLIDIASFRDHWRLARVQALVGLATFVATLALAPHVELGLLVGLGAAVAAHLWREQRLSIRTWEVGDVLHVRPRGVLYYASAPSLEDLVANALAGHREVGRLAIHLDGLGRVDLTGAMALREIVLDARAAGLEIALVDVPGQAIHVVSRVLGDDVSVSPPSGEEPAPEMPAGEGPRNGSSAT